ncbi:SDR family oxidoreductase [Candidatus Nanohalovita haloferacivicina]|uniref:SDR family oxidoreductase n=1 Tax=Candidatus Nanohalovita haloferacivicina TaxID=2978046 RepID=UPI00325FD54D|nr:NADH dehydrogenase (ubiquinone) 1 alpha subcomplex, subunit 9 [Candidatus Nanohalobia archaeon BNXNv]
MDVLIAGKGFIGKSIGERLSSEGHTVKYLDRTDGDYHIDICKEFGIDRSFDVIYHCIGLAPGFYTERNYFKVHVEGTRNLIKGVDADRIVYLSALGAGEIDHSYFNTKKKAEELIEDSGLDYTIVRPSTVLGHGNKMLDSMRDIAFTRIFPNIPTQMQPIEGDDLVEILYRCLDDYSGEILEVAGDEKVSVGELARDIYREEGYSCHLVSFPVFMTEAGLLGLRFLPPPFLPENRVLLKMDNTLEENDAKRVLGE